MILVWLGICAVVLMFGIRYWRRRHWAIFLGVLVLLLGLGIVSGYLTQSPPAVALIRTQQSLPQKWHLVYWYLNGTQQRHIRLQQRTLAIRSNLKKGQLTVMLKAPGQPTQVIPLKQQDHRKINLNQYTVHQRLILRLQAQGAQGETTLTW